MQQEIANRRRTTLEVSLDDLEEYSKDPELVTRLERNTQQYLTLLAEGADNRMPAPCEDDLPEDVFDVLLDQVGLRRHAGSASAASERACISAGSIASCVGQACRAAQQASLDSCCQAASRLHATCNMRPPCPATSPRACLPAPCSANVPRR